MSTSASSPCSSEEEGLHLTPLPRIAGRYFGGGGTGTPPHNIGLFVFSPAVDGELTYGGVNTVHHTEVHTNCSLKGLKHLDTMKLSANPLVDAVDDVVNLMAVHSLIMRSAAILFEHFFLARGALVFPVVSVWKVDLLGVLFLCSCVKHPKLPSPHFQIFMVTWTYPHHSCTESLAQVEGQ